jgi:hypothetical protein
LDDEPSGEPCEGFFMASALYFAADKGLVTANDLSLEEFELLMAYSTGLNQEQKEYLDGVQAEHKAKAQLEQKQKGLRVGKSSEVLRKKYPHLFK